MMKKSLNSRRNQEEQLNSRKTTKKSYDTMYRAMDLHRCDTKNMICVISTS